MARLKPASAAYSAVMVLPEPLTAIVSRWLNDRNATASVVMTTSRMSVTTRATPRSLGRRKVGRVAPRAPRTLETPPDSVFPWRGARGARGATRPTRFTVSDRNSLVFIRGKVERVHCSYSAGAEAERMGTRWRKTWVREAWLPR